MRMRRLVTLLTLVSALAGAGSVFAAEVRPRSESLDSRAELPAFFFVREFVQLFGWSVLGLDIKPEPPPEDPPVYPNDGPATDPNG